MISGSALRLVLLVSCAHALVHTYELALPSVEQKIAGEYSPDNPEAGKEFTGKLSNYWRLPWGCCALVAGFLVDRFGSRRMLVVYLLGCSVMCALVAGAQSAGMLAAAMIGMGTMASIYHPAGLALISHETNAENRTRALGIHGIFGSAGIGAAPIIAGVLIAAGLGWRQYYWALTIPGLVLGCVFLWQVLRRGRTTAPVIETATTSSDEDHTQWKCFFTLTILALLQGFVYSAVMAFLTRYLTGWEPQINNTESFARYATGGVLLIGCIGQYTAGRWARASRLEWQLVLVTFGNAPFLLWMAFADGWTRAAAAAMFALVHFMHQPIYNSLIAKYTPRRRRSLCYGFSFAMGLGLGSFGARFAGDHQSETLIYGTLAAIAAVAGCVGVLLTWLNRR